MAFSFSAFQRFSISREYETERRITRANQAIRIGDHRVLCEAAERARRSPGANRYSERGFNAKTRSGKDAKGSEVRKMNRGRRPPSAVPLRRTGPPSARLPKHASCGGQAVPLRRTGGIRGRGNAERGLRDHGPLSTSPRTPISPIRCRGCNFGIKGSGSANLPAQVVQSIL
jgi:hypothetical protein